MSELKGRLYATDLNALILFNSSIKCKFLDRIMPLITHLGSAIGTILICLLLIIFGKNELRIIGLQALVALVLSHIPVHFLKHKICRLRPKDALPNINTFNISLDYYSFPSGHTTAIFAIAVTLSLNIQTLIPICLPIALLVGITRLYLGVHYPSDLLAGVVVGSITSVTIHMIINSLYTFL